jgi:uncharacterized RDD family membrane protein YckC
VGAGLIVSVLHLPKEVKTVLIALGGAVYVLWTIGYFVVFWSTTGQTPGNRMMQIRVVPAEGGTLKPRRALVRCFGLVLAALPLLAGYFMILFDRRRRGLQDRIARTVVVEASQLSLAELQRAQRRVARAAAAGPQPRPTRSSESGDDRGGSREEAPAQRERLTPDSADRS